MQVKGCGKDLSGLKDYHQRYRICEVRWLLITTYLACIYELCLRASQRMSQQGIPEGYTLSCSTTEYGSSWLTRGQVHIKLPQLMRCVL
jgi:hypothetical protein